MSVSSTGTNALDAISASYQPYEQTTEETEDALGRDAFLTMLVAQLENQDPLNPMDGTDFSAQLAQYSQLEQLMNLNESMESLISALEGTSGKDPMEYIGMEVTGTADTMTVDEGTVSGGFYNLTEPADVAVTITDADGSVVRTLYPGQQEAGAYLVSWDGTDASGDAVADGTYSYTVMADYGSGYETLSASLSGTVEGVAYNNGKAYLVVQGILLDPDAVTSATNLSETAATGLATSPAAYLGQSISSTAPIVLVEDGAVSGSGLSFELDTQSDAVISVYDAYDELVRTIEIDADDTAAGENAVVWDGLSDNGYQVQDGMYYYTVSADDGSASTPVSGEVSAVKTVNGSPYLVLADSGRLVSVSNVTEIF
ncbi:MAG: flagellar hook capping protein [Desulfobacter sp.]|nr:MAG: flagellar hook capping protein [Desulfobacter sp.]